jgi:hypothetical protein
LLVPILPAHRPFSFGLLPAQDHDAGDRAGLLFADIVRVLRHQHGTPKCHKR